MYEYEGYDRIGIGGYGSIFKVVKKGENKEYAMKIMEIKKDITQLTIENELNIMKKVCTMNHPNLIKYIEHFWEDSKNKCSVIMEYCPNGDLSKVIEKANSQGQILPEDVILKYLFDILSGVEFMHENEIVHKDLKPSNILIGYNGDLKICDFGISRQLCTIKTHTMFPIGTSGYASPEVVNNTKYSTSADMWSIGCILYELCCLKPLYPIEGGIEGEYEKLLNETKLDLNNIPAIYSEKLKELIPIMLELDKSLRPTCANLLSREIFKRRLIHYLNGDKYYGEHKNGMRNGIGTLYSADGSVYKGKWNDDKRDGKGATYGNDGTESHEEWNKGKCLQNKL